MRQSSSPTESVGVLGHIAAFDAAGLRHYYPVAFTFDPVTRQRSAMKLLAERTHLPAGVSKRADLADVLFSGGMTDGSLYVGAGDAEVYRIDDVKSLRFGSGSQGG